jgi:hypothetical protein
VASMVDRLACRSLIEARRSKASCVMRKGRNSLLTKPGRDMSAGKTEAMTHLVIPSNPNDIFEVVPLALAERVLAASLTIWRAQDLIFGQTFSNHSSRETPRPINMSKIRLPLLDLQRRALAEIRRMPGCHNVQEIAINRVTVEGADFNWSTCVLSSGSADANTAARAAIHVQSVLRRDYDLLTD